jgi:transketolase
LENFWWHVQEIDGHDYDELDNAFSSLSSEKPNVIIANTIKWKWVSFMEDKVEFHYRPPTQEQLEAALIELS